MNRYLIIVAENGWSLQYDNKLLLFMDLGKLLDYLKEILSQQV